MPLHVNLYHEIQRKERARQWDPTRLAMLAALLIAIVLAVNYFITLERAHSINVRFTNVQGAYDGIAPAAKTAKDRQDVLNTEIQASDALRTTVDSRFDWAPVFAEILSAAPRYVQFTHIDAAMPDDDKAASSTITVNGISSGLEPRKEADHVRTQLEAQLSRQFKHVTSVFRQLEDSDEFVMLDGRRLPTATFAIEYQIQLHEPVAEVAPTHHKRRAESE